MHFLQPSLGYKLSFSMDYKHEIVNVDLTRHTEEPTLHLSIEKRCGTE